MHKRHILFIVAILLIVCYYNIQKEYKVDKKPNTVVTKNSVTPVGVMPVVPINDCDVLVKYKYILKNYFPSGYEFEAEDEFKYSGMDLIGSTQYKNEDYRCYTIIYDTPNSGSGYRSMILPVTKMSDFWMNEILWNEIHENILYILTEYNKNILRVDTDAYRYNQDILKNPYKVNLNNFTLEQLKHCETTINLYTDIKSEKKLRKLKETLNKLRDKNGLDNITFKVINE